MKPTVIKFVGNAQDEWGQLNAIVGEQQSKKIKNSPEQQLLKSIKQKIDLLEANRQYGAMVPKKIIPSEFKKLEITNLWVVDLTGYWRLLYTLHGNKLEVLCVILEIIDHDKYNKIFNYKKK